MHAREFLLGGLRQNGFLGHAPPNKQKRCLDDAELYNKLFLQIFINKSLYGFS